MNSRQRRKARRLAAHNYCGYWHGGTIECRGDGYMWDADCDGFDPEDHSMPCPSCNTKVWLEQAKEEAECVSSFSGTGGDGTGLTIWQNAVAIASKVAPQAAAKALLQIGCVRPIEADDSSEGFKVHVFNYA